MRVAAIIAYLLLSGETLCQDVLLSANFSTFFEARTAKINRSGTEERESKTKSSSLGLKAIYIQDRLKLGFGLSYVNRKYDMTRPFDNCYFSPPGTGCTMLYLLTYVNGYRYSTMELPVSLDMRVFETQHWNFFLGVTYTSAFILKSEYDPYIGAMDTFEDKGQHGLFSRSVIGQFGVCYELSRSLYLNAQPFVRIYSSQRGDPVLYESQYSWMKATFDSFGVNVELLYRLNRERDL